MKNILLSIMLLLSTIAYAEVDSLPELKKITKKEFRQNIWNPNKNKKFTYNGTQPIVLEFNATWCKPCKRIYPMLKEIQVEFGDSLTIYSIDIDKEPNNVPDYPTIFKFETVPTIVLIKPNAKKIPKAIRIGGAEKEDLKNLFRSEFFIEKK